VALKKPSDLFGKNKEENNNIPVVETNNSLREELTKVESLSEQINQLQQELSQKVVQTDLEKLVLSQINTMQENFAILQEEFQQSNERDISKFREVVSQLGDIVGNLVENEIPKYKKQITSTDIRIGEKFNEFKEDVEDNINNIREDVKTKVESIASAIDDNLDYFNQQLQETSSDVKKTVDTYNKLSKIVENKVSKENEKLEEYSQVIKSLYESFVELEESLQEETSTHRQIVEEVIEDKFESISSNVSNRIDIINEEVDNIKDKVSSEISNIKADVVIFEKHNNDTQKTIQEFSEQLSKISKLDESIVEINENIDTIQNQYEGVSNQSIETKNNLEVVERYIQNHHQELIELKEEVFAEIEKIPVGNLQENLDRLEKKIDYIKETYSRIEPEVIVKEVIKEGLLNDPPETKNSDPLTPLNKNFVTLDQLQEHYRLFINRIQQQLSTLGGGGETRLEFLDDIDRNSAKVNGRFLKYDAASSKWVGALGGGGGSQTLDDTLGLGNTSSLGMSVGVVTATYFVGDGSLLTNVLRSVNSGYANTAGIATYATTSGISTYAQTAGISTYSTSSGVSTYATSSGIATYATTSGISTNATYATTAGVSTTATTAGYATTAGISTYATTTGIATSVIGGIGSVTQLRVSGVSTLGVSTFTGAVSFGSSALFGDLDKLYFGDGNDLEIYHNGFNSLISDVGQGGLIVDGSSLVYQASISHQFTNTSLSKTYAAFVGDVVTFYYDNNKKFETLGTGVTITGTTFTNDLSVSGVTTSIGGFVGNLTGNSSTATYATIAGIATYATSSGIATYSNTAGVSTYASTAGIATYAATSGIATYATTAGVSTTATTAGYATTSGIATVAQGLTGTPNIVVGVATVTGNLNAPGNYYVKLARLTNQTVPQNTDTLIGFTATSDTNGWYSGITTRTTPTVAGTYNVNVMMNISAGSVTNNQTNIQLRKNGSTFAISQVGIQTFQYTMTACGIVTMNGTTDYIEFSVYTGNPGGQTVTGTADGAWTKMEMFKIN
jgi:predicted  nucleic acid-binding Zn-ribbon protein